MRGLRQLQKRVEKEKASLLEFANESFAKELLIFPDNLERALHHSREGADNGLQVEALRSGVELTLKCIHDVFKKFGIEPVIALGKNSTTQGTRPSASKRHPKAKTARS